MRMKKFFALLLVLSLSSSCAVLGACKDDPIESSSVESSSSTDSSSQSSEDGTSEEVVYTLSLEKTEYTVVEDETFFLGITVEPVGSVKWTVSDPTVLSVDGDASGATVLAKKVGVATITATCGNASQSCAVTVTPTQAKATVLLSDVEEYAAELKGESIELSFSAYELALDGTLTKIENAEITYSSGNEKLATVSGSTLTALRHGTLQVCATYENVSSYADVIIYDNFVSDTTEWNQMIENASMGEYYLLDADIDFEGVAYASVVTSNADNLATGAFRATLNGNGHTVKNVTLTGKANQYVSLFGKVYNGKISNVSFENIVIGGADVQGAGLVSAITGAGALLENIYLDLTYSVRPYRAGVIAYNCYGGTIQGVIATVDTPSDDAAEDNVSIVYAGAENVTVKGVYALGEGELADMGAFKGYSLLIDMVWDVNGEKLLDASTWTYFGGTKLPKLNKNS